jgi:hypothetical protein
VFDLGARVDISAPFCSWGCMVYMTNHTAPKKTCDSHRFLSSSKQKTCDSHRFFSSSKQGTNTTNLIATTMLPHWHRLPSACRWSSPVMHSKSPPRVTVVHPPRPHAEPNLVAPSTPCPVSSSISCRTTDFDPVSSAYTHSPQPPDQGHRRA